MQHALSFSSLIAPGSAGIERERAARPSREPEETSFGSIMAEQQRASREEAAADARPVAPKRDDRRAERKEEAAEPEAEEVRDTDATCADAACAPAQQAPAEAGPPPGETDLTVEVAGSETLAADPEAEAEAAEQTDAAVQPESVEAAIPLAAGAVTAAPAGAVPDGPQAAEMPVEEALKGAAPAVRAKQIRAQEPQSTLAAPPAQARAEGAAMPAIANAPMAEAVRRVSSDVASARLEANITAREARIESLPVVRVSPAQFAFSAFISSDEMMATVPESSTGDEPTELAEVSDEFARAVERGGSFRATEAGAGLSQGARVFRPAAAALAERVTASPSGEVDLQLSPEELGNLRISFTQDDSGLSVVIRADRAETLDLLRRHISQFTQDLREQGFEEVTISFGDRGGAATNGGWAEAEANTRIGTSRFAETSGAQLAPQPAASVQKVTNGGLDLRL